MQVLYVYNNILLVILRGNLGRFYLWVIVNQVQGGKSPGHSKYSFTPDDSSGTSRSFRSAANQHY